MVSDVLEVNDSLLQVGDEVVVCSKAGVEATTCFEVRDVAAGCSGAGIEDGRWR
jgi:hypothetical protein